MILQTTAINKRKLAMIGPDVFVWETTKKWGQGA